MYVCMYVCVCVCMCVCMYVCIVCIVCIVCMYICMYVCICMYMYVCMYVCMHVCSLCMHVCMHPCIHASRTWEPCSAVKTSFILFSLQFSKRIFRHSQHLALKPIRRQLPRPSSKVIYQDQPSIYVMVATS